MVHTSPDAWLDSSMAPEPGRNQSSNSLNDDGQSALQDLALCLCQALATGISAPSESMGLLLMLLRMLRAHPQTVAPIVMQHHKSIPARVWHAVIPQLFAQLHHNHVRPLTEHRAQKRTLLEYHCSSFMLSLVYIVSLEPAGLHDI